MKTWEGLVRAPCAAAGATPEAAPLTIWVVAAPRTLALSTVAKAHATNPWAVSRKKTSLVWMSGHFLRRRAAKYPPIAEDITATTTR